MSDPVTPATTLPPVVQPSSGLGAAALPQVVVIVGTILAVLCAVPVALIAGGVAMPVWIVPVCGAVSAILGAFGIASPGLRKS